MPVDPSVTATVPKPLEMAPDKTTGVAAPLGLTVNVTLPETPELILPEKTDPLPPACPIVVLPKSVILPPNVTPP